jgi:2-polyprenyl-3-methyl-5-hydroxy-6-metoxy-1,4-benzoquinol methylase/uncharacterized coiled-coil DUF342 family protein
VLVASKELVRLEILLWPFRGYRLRRRFLLWLGAPDPDLEALRQARLEQEVTEVIHQISEVREYALSVWHEVAAAKGRLDHISVALANLQEHSRQQDDRIAGVVADVEAFRGRFSALEQHSRLVTDDLSTVKQQVSDLSEDALGLTDEVGGIRQQVTGVTQQVSDLSEHALRLTDEVGGIRQKVTDVGQRVTDVSDHALRLTDEVAGIRQKVTDVGQQVTDVSEHALRLTDEVAGIRQQLTGVRQQVSDVSEHALRLTDEVAGIRQQATGVTQQVSDVSEHTLRLTDEVAGMRQQVMDVTQQVEDVGTHAARVTEQLAEVRQQSIELKAGLYRIGEAYVLLEQSLSALGHEQVNLSQKLGDVETRQSKSDHEFLTNVDTLEELVLSDRARDPEPSFDYVGFERRFRGSEELIRARQEQYVRLFPPGDVVLDIGCGRGEFMELLSESGRWPIGVDLDEGMVRLCREKGLQVEHDHALAFLERCQDNSLGGIFAAQVVEHLPFGYVTHLAEMAYRKLRPGGVLIVETVNPHCPEAMNWFHLDPTHDKPVFPEYLIFLCESKGFSDVHVRYTTPASYAQDKPESERGPRDYGDYAVVGVKALS